MDRTRGEAAKDAFKRALDDEMTRVNCRRRQLVELLNAADSQARYDMRKVKRWCVGENLPQSRGDVAALERALRTAAEDQTMEPQADGWLLDIWQSTSSDMTAAGASRKEANGQADLVTLCRELIDAAESRDHFQVRLPPLTVPARSTRSRRPRTEIADVVKIARRFGARPEERLLVVIGEFGGGKSHVLRAAAREAVERDAVPVYLAFAELLASWNDSGIVESISILLERHSERAAREFQEQFDRNPTSLVFLVDSIDEGSLLSAPAESGSVLELLRPLLDAGSKLAIATRPSLTSTAENFHRQIKQQGLDGGYDILELLTCKRDQANAILDLLPEGHSQVVKDYLASSEKTQMQHILSPLSLQMLLDLPQDSFDETSPFSVYALYDTYIESVLERERTLSKTKIPTRSKRRILMETAKEMFAQQLARGHQRISRDDLNNKILTEVNEPENQSWVAHHESHSWFIDFVETTPIVSSANTRSLGGMSFEFIHHSIFEFLLAQQLIWDFEMLGSFGLNDAEHSVRAFDSLLPYFMRAQFDGYEERLERMVVQRDTSHLDRLLGFFLLEDSPKVRELLAHQSVSTKHAMFLHKAEQQFESYFMKKVARFQLVLLDDGIARALAYVCDARVKELDTQLDMEVHTFAAKKPPTEFLLGRVANPQLRNALPIWIYRLGLFGDESALDELNRLADHPEPMLRALVSEAVDAIEARARRR